ncbi:MAG TPA: DUF2298 domain-containing protein [Anaerolineae bacterium]|nr:DUF2298 domain-containing protein [Anaerolineae bacterium]
MIGDIGWNSLANAGPLAAALAWWLALAAMGWAAWPLCLRACRGLPDRGYLVAKAVGWLLVGYIVWLGASTRVLENRPATAHGALALVAAVGAWAAYRRRGELAALWYARRGLLVGEELLFGGAFAALVLVRLLNPDLWQPWFGGEKMMEIAYLNAIVRSAHFPPYNPYFAGSAINYYYYGLHLVNVLIKLTGVLPQVAFNLAVPTFFALTVAGAFSFGHALTSRLQGRRRLWGGVAAALGVAVLGNLTVLVQWLASMVSAGGAVPTPTMGLEALGPLATGVGRWLSGQASLASFDYWYAATRIIPYTINEFPFFSYLFADLHPHMMALPFTIAALVLVAGRFFASRGGVRALRSASDRNGTLKGGLVGLAGDAARPRAGGVASQPDQPPTRVRAGWARSKLAGWFPGLWPLALLALVLGALGPMNTWDVPTYLGLVMVVLVWLGLERGRLWQGVAEALGVAALALALYLPFYRHYAPQKAAPQLLLAHTGLRYFLAIWGLWLVALYGWLGARWWQGRQGADRATTPPSPSPGEGGGEGETRRRWLAVGAAALALAALLAGEAVVALLLPVVALAVDLWLRRDVPRAERLAALVAAWGGLILCGIEFVYLADFLQGTEWQRMNTVFKFGVQAWVLLALAGAVGLAAMWGRMGGVLHPARRDRLESLSHRPGGLRLVWTAALVGLAAVSLAYVPLGVVARVAERTPGGPPPSGTLDGLAYMRSGVYHWPDDLHTIELRYDDEAIQWLLANVQGTPVIAEAPLGYYREGGMRVSSYTGLPTLAGMHQNEQLPPDQVAERQAQAERLYRAGSPQETHALLQELHVQYVYFGQLEAIEYGQASAAKFAAMAQRGELEVVYSNPRVVIYRADL